MRVHVHIERLVLDDVADAAGGGLGPALQEELSRRLAAGGLPTGLQEGTAIGSLSAAMPAAPGGRGMADLGRAIAGATYRAMNHRAADRSAGGGGRNTLG